MKEVIIELQAAGYYSAHYENDWLMYTLGGFLAYDVGHQASWWLNWLADGSQQFTFANATALEKYGSDVVLIDMIDSIRAEPNLVPMNYVLKIDGNRLIKLIQIWQNLVAKQVPAIKVELHDDGTIELFHGTEKSS